MSVAKSLIIKKYLSDNEAELAYTNKSCTLHEKILVQRSAVVDGVKKTKLVETTVGRIIFNHNIPQDLGYVDRTNPETMFNYEVDFIVGKKQLGKIIDRCIRVHGTSITADMLDKIKATGYKYSTLSAITVAVSDIKRYRLRRRISSPRQKRKSRISRISTVSVY